MAEEEGPFPCVVYCHCNSGSRRDAEEAVILLVPQKISVFCLDFSVECLHVLVCVDESGLGFWIIRGTVGDPGSK